jgi:hypothetical protein
MTSYPNLAQAQAHPGVIHVHRVADDQWAAYEAVDEIPRDVRVAAGIEQPDA